MTGRACVRLLLCMCPSAVSVWTAICHLQQLVSLTIRPLWSSLPADTPPPAYMPPDEQMGQEGAMEISSSGPRNMPSGGEESELKVYLTWGDLFFSDHRNSCFQTLSVIHWN